MPVTTDSLFGLTQMGESVALFEQLPQKLMLQTEVFTPEPCFGDTYTFDREDFLMSLAPFVGGRKAPSKAVKSRGKRRDAIPLAHIRVHKVMHAADLYTMRAPGEISDNAAVEVGKIRTQLYNKAKLAAEFVCAQAMRGDVEINPTTIPDSEEVISISRPVTALTPLDAPWSGAGAKIIPKDLQVWRNQILQASGFDPSSALFEKAVTQYLLGNTGAIDWLSKTQKGVDVFSAAQFSKLGGIDGWKEYRGFYTPEGGNATTFITANEFFLLPEPAAQKQICRLIEGYAEIPSTAIGAPPGPIAGATKAPQPGYVDFAIPIADGDPPGVKIVGVYYFMPLVKVPEAIGYRASVIA